MEHINKIRNCKKVIICGGVAVGKSSIINSVINYLLNKNVKYIYIPEYIDIKPDALDMLNKYLKKEITVYEFQTYVINYYDEYLTQIKINGDEVLLFERGIGDAITCFSNLDYYNDGLTTNEFCTLYNLVRDLDKKYNLPSYFNKQDNNETDKIFIPIKTEDKERDGNIIGSIICNRNITNIIIGLYNDDKVCYERMIKRNRPGEKEAYTLNKIEMFNYTYKQLYRNLMDKGYINFISLGKLIKM